MIDGEWVNSGTDEEPRYEHVHVDRIRHKTDRTIPFLSSEPPRFYTASYICRQCRAALECRWPARP